ncbi:DMT family transporter [Rhodococcus chondri]|uniref:DMT family transporter n=1 Tax=Rhodococcus chondri TaxID=3065941 RepID=A0ABU7JWT4_9NOCA|nr:DMT family transporter [Rhodococcus sp. CC-R104]MEE2034374.1 DMT family transporter [Rhodococcus sp. CC-R104]
MTGTAAASVACALAAAVLFAGGGVAQQRSAAAVPTSQSLLGSLVRSPRWWMGVLGDGGGYLLQVAALALGAVLVVQPLLVSSLLFALPMSAALTGQRITRRTWLLALALCAALVVFLVVGDPTERELDAAARQWALPLGLILGLTAVTVLTAAAGSRPHAAGILFGVTVAFTKHVTDLFTHGVVAVLGSWQTWALLVAGITGAYLQQRAFQAGPLAASLPALTIGEPLAAVFLCMTVLGERLQVHGLGLVVVAAAVAVMLTTTVALSRAQAATAAG